MSFDDYTADQWREKHEAARRQWHEERTKLQEELKATQRELEYVSACSRQRDEENASLSSANAELVEVLRKIRNDTSLWKAPRAGGQDQYAGMPPFCRIIDAAMKEGRR